MMEPMNIEAPPIACIPMEILYKILLMLPTVVLMKSRGVCRAWRASVDALTSRDETWQWLCERDYAGSYKQARIKCHPTLTWRQLYQSLHLWTKLDAAKNTWTELVSFRPRDDGTIDSLHLYKDSIVVMGYDKMVYCDKDTLKPKERLDIDRNELFTENEYVAAYLSFTDPHWSQLGDLKIVPKIDEKLLLDHTVKIEDVPDFTIVDKDVYYYKSIRDVYKIFVCKCSDNYNSTELITAPLPVWGLSYYENCLHVMLGGYNVYKIDNNIFTHVKDEDNIFKTLKYGFSIRDHDYETMFHMSTSMGINYLISKLIVYNNLIFTGSEDGVLRIYNAELAAKGPKSDSIVKYDISEMFEMEGDLFIRGLDVMERDNGHTIYLSTSKKILTLDLTH